MARKKIDLNKGQTLLILGNNTPDPIKINRINPHSDVYDGFELTVLLEKPTVAPAIDSNEVMLTWVKEGIIETNLMLRTTGNNQSTGFAQSSIIGPTYYSSLDTYPYNMVCAVRFVWSAYYQKWVEITRQYVSYS